MRQSGSTRAFGAGSDNSRGRFDDLSLQGLGLNTDIDLSGASEANPDSPAELVDIAGELDPGDPGWEHPDPPPPDPDPDPDPPPPDPPPDPDPEPPPPDPSVSFTTGAVSVTEGDAGQTWLELELVLSEPADHDIVVWVAVTGGTATEGDDFDLVMVAVVISAGSTTAVIPVALNGDTTREDDETFTIAIVDTDGATTGVQDTTMVTIANDDARGKPR